MVRYERNEEKPREVRISKVARELPARSVNLGNLSAKCAQISKRRVSRLENSLAVGCIQTRSTPCPVPSEMSIVQGTQVNTVALLFTLNTSTDYSVVTQD